MLPEELLDLVQQVVQDKAERRNIELKKVGGGAPKRLYDTLSSFANQSGGGIIIFGIDEANSFEITGVYDPQDLQKKVVEQANQMEPILRPLITIAEINGKHVLSAEIAECDIFDKPCFYKGAGRLKGSYMRVGDADEPMTEYEVYSYEAFKKQRQDELRVSERSSIQDFSSLKLEEYLIELRKNKPNIQGLERDHILKTQGMMDQGKPTLAGLLVLGEYPQAYYPQLSVIAVVVPGNQVGDEGVDGERFIDNQRIEGTIPQMLESSLQFVRRNMRTKTIISEDGHRTDKSEYPAKALREILLNALIHRDYSQHTDRSPIRVVLYEDRLEIENPGGLYGRITLDQLGEVTADTRNPYLASALEILGITENRFSGIPTIRRACREHGIPEPEFVNRRGNFKVCLWKTEKTDVQEVTLNKLSSNVTPINQVQPTEEQILSFCMTPKSRHDLTAHFHFDSTSYFIKRYINPLLESGKLEMTIPDKPRSRYQKYQTTRS